MWRSDAKLQVSSKHDAYQLYQERTIYGHPRGVIRVFRVI